MKGQPASYSSQSGAALATSLILLAILSLLGGTATILTTTDLHIGRNYKSNVRAFYDGETGVNYALSKIETGLQNGTFSLPGSIGRNVTLSYVVPNDFSFTISGITKIAANGYSFTSTGYGPGNSSESVLKVTFARESAINFAAFGDSKLDAKSGGSTQSYDSGSSVPWISDPTHASFNSTHEADVGSNDDLTTHSGAFIDGNGVFGAKDDGTATANNIDGQTIFYGTAPVNADRIDPDPLGVTSPGG
ncbi:MAG: hypothetical protein K9K79_11985, partial [Desulfohalobiaceae bacterium]|nr:hypothetical protein [Desulfohalobiaceae bacterium]